MITFRKAQNNEDNLSHIVKCIIKHLNLKIPYSEVSSYLLGHHAYPSILSIKDFFNYYAVGTEVIYFNRDEFSKYQGPLVIVNVNGHFALAENLKGGFVSVLDSLEGRSTVKVEVLTFEIENVLLYFTSLPETLVSKWFERIPYKWLGICLTTSILFFITFVEDTFTISDFLLLLFDAAGLVMSLTLFVAKSNSSAASMVCSYKEFGSFKIDCRSVINSKQSKIFGVDFVDIAIVLFASLSLNLLSSKLFFIDETGRLIYFIIITASLPVTLLLFRFQILTKTICTFCSGISLVLLGQLVIVLSNPPLVNGFESIKYSVLLVLACEFIFVCCFWAVFRNIFNKATSGFEIKSRFISLKRNVFVLKIMLGDPISAGKSCLDIIFGDENNKNSILLVAKLGCVSCPGTVEKFYSLWKELPDRTVLRIRLIDLAKLPHDKLSPFLSRINSKQFRLLLKEMITSNCNKTSDAELREHNASLDYLHLRTVPQVYWNHYALPLIYDIDDIRYLITLESPSNE